MPVKRGSRAVVAVVCLALLFALPRCAEAEAGGAAGASAPRARKIGPHLYALGEVVIDAAGRSIRCPGRVNMDAGGPIEVLACLPQGKVHESVLTLEVEPLDLQLALLLLGLEPGRNPGAAYAEGAPERDQKPGDMVELYVEWKEPVGEEPVTQRVVRRRAEELLYDVARDRPLPPTRWVFVGSRWVDGRLGAEVNGTLVSTYLDPLAILELPSEQVNDDTWCVVREGLLPPVGTRVELVIVVPADSGEDSSPRRGGEEESGR